MPITVIDKSTARQLTDRAIALLSPMMAEFGITISPAGGTFNDGQLTLKVALRLETVNGVAHDEASFRSHAAIYNLPASAYGATITTPSGPARLVAIQPRRSKRPIVIEYVSRPGKRYLIEDAFVRKCLGRQWDWEKRTPGVPAATP